MIFKVAGTVLVRRSFVSFVEVEKESDIYPLLNHYLGASGEVKAFREEGPSSHYETIIGDYERVPEELLEDK